MGRITLQQAAQWCGGKIDPKYKDVAFWGANNDTRKLQEGQLFVALQGVRDGHDFIPAALEKGAAAVVTATKPDADIPYVLVEDDRIALALIGTNYFDRPAESMTMIGTRLGIFAIPCMLIDAACVFFLWSAFVLNGSNTPLETGVLILYTVPQTLAFFSNAASLARI